MMISLLFLWGSMAAPVGLFAQGPAMSPAMPAPVIPDTVRAELIWPEDMILPSALYVVPDTVQFGEMAGIICEFPAGSVLPDAKGLDSTADWLSLPLSVEGDQLERLAGSAGDFVGNETLLIPIRVYRTDPFIIFCGPVESSVIQVFGKTTDLASIKPIRDPRLRGWNLLILVVVALGLTLFMLLVWYLWRRRARPTVLVDWDPMSPAWIVAADRLRDLLGSGSLDRNRGRDFLNELASIARGFASDRYGIAAREMTGKEIVSACRERGFPGSAPGKLARLIDDADCRRYDPELVDPAWCRNQAGQLIHQMSAVRIIPRQTPVPPKTRLGAEKAWTILQDFLAESESDSRGGIYRPLSSGGA
ncbi:MAG: hypothetical protein KOO60_11580 [Gemmatimonadales bacterium]|nr:hypothetical protein [Gemmatimonadales bacterium]